MKVMRLGLAAATLSLLLGVSAATAEEKASTKSTASERSRTASARSIVARKLPTGASEDVKAELSGQTPIKNHPLRRALAYAQAAHKVARESVDDFTCTLIKREQVNGYLREPQFLSAAVRSGQSEGQQVAVPYSVYLHFLKPAKVAGRKVVYVDGKNGGKMLVRNGGKRFNYVTVKVDPFGETALEDTPVPITELGFETQTASIIDLLQDNMRRDPLAENTKVAFYKGAKVGSRVCTRISVVHPKQDKGLEFHKAEVFIDNELQLPIHIQAYGWPTAEGKDPPLLAEYTYSDLKINVGLSDADFDPSRLGTKATIE